VSAMSKWKLVSKHEYEFISAFPRYVKTIVGLLCGIGMTVGGAAILVYGTGGRNAVSGYIFGLLFLLFGILLTGLMILSWPWRRIRWVRVYEEGLRWEAGSREHKCRWDEVTDLNRTEMDVVGPDGRRTDWTRSASLLLRLADGSRVRFDPALVDYGKLARLVQEHVTLHQLHGATAELDETGKTFGPVHLTRKGVTAAGRFFSWTEVRWLAAHNGQLCAHHECTAWQPILLNDIPNYLLLLSLVKELGRLRE
jgi:hypothetical protein